MYSHNFLSWALEYKVGKQWSLLSTYSLVGKEKNTETNNYNTKKGWFDDGAYRV